MVPIIVLIFLQLYVYVCIMYGVSIFSNAFEKGKLFFVAFIYNVSALCLIQIALPSCYHFQSQRPTFRVL